MAFSDIKIGFSGDEDWQAMRRPDVRIVFFSISLKESDVAPPPQDYRPLIQQILEVFLQDAGLSAQIMHPSGEPEGLTPGVGGYVWRQHGTEYMETVSGAEFFRLSDLLRAPGSRVKSFLLRELITTEKLGFRPHRILRFKEGVLTIEPPAA